jgi:hypothetical protein
MSRRECAYPDRFVPYRAHRMVRRTCRILGVVCVGAVALASCGGGGGGAEPLAHGSAKEGVGAAAREVCEPMVRESVPVAVGAPLLGEPISATRGDTFSCRYAFDGGALVLSVRDLRTLGQARERLRELRDRDGVTEALPGLAEGGFTSSDGSVVAKKDAMILTVDTTELPPGVEKANVAIEVAAAVLECW